MIAPSRVCFVPRPYAGIWRRLDGLAERLGATNGWRAGGLAVLLGAVSSLALPPAFVFPILWLTFPSLLWLLHGDKRPRPGRRAFLLGWCFGFGLYAASLYWISNALLVFSSQFWWAVPFAALGLPAILAIYTGLAALIASRFRPGAPRVIAFAAAWTAGEYARGHLFTGFPWNQLGHAWAGGDTMLQPAATIGVYGLTALVTVSACLPALAARTGHMMRGSVLALAAALPLFAHLQGLARLDSAPPPGVATAADTGLRLVQANIPQREKWRRDLRAGNFALQLRLSIQDRPDWVTQVIWPEAAAAFFIADDPEALALAGRAAPPGGYLLTGAPRRGEGSNGIYNSVFAIDTAGTIAATYDKAHLVPFGEYSPLEGILPAIAATGGSFSAGPGPRTLTLPGLPPFSPLICYEAIFPGAVVDRNGTRPEWFLNLTNDAWYGISAGPYQHLIMARLRSVEEGMPLVRATNTGITAAFDAWGREIGRLPLGVQGVLDIRLPRALPEPTLYARYGDTAFWLFLIGLSIGAIFANRRAARDASGNG